MPLNPPRLLLVGAGRFGAQHLGELERLRDEGRVDLAGVVVRTGASAAALRDRVDVPVHEGLDGIDLARFDAVDIVTPPHTHAAIVERCLPHVHVFVEKPLAGDEGTARRLAARAAEHGRVLMAGHVYRYHPSVRRLAEMVAELGVAPTAVYGRMTNPLSDRAGRGEPALEFLHLVDILDCVLGVEPEVAHGVTRGQVVQTSLRYPGPTHAVLDVGWEGEGRSRTLRLVFPDRRIDCQLADAEIVTTFRDHQCEKEFAPHPVGALRAELLDFLAAVGTGATPAADAATGARVVGVAARTRPAPRPAPPRVLVIGGGAFGTVAAIELGQHFDVTLAERHDDLLTEASFANQWRHHAGFHYPRSFDQIQEIKDSRGAFEEAFGDVILRSSPAYFCTAASAREIPAETYHAACVANDLSFRVSEPPAEVVDPAMVSLCLEVDEGVYDFGRLKSEISRRLAETPRVDVRLATEVTGARIGEDGTKLVTLRRDGGESRERFDYVVNATYANRNLLARWLGFPVEPLRFDFLELVIIRLPVSPVCVSIVDGPFMSLVATGHDDEFILSHAVDSQHYAVVTEDGLPPPSRPWRSNRDNMLRHTRRYFPVLERAEILESRFAYRAVPAHARDFDARPTVVSDHGFGCWSVLGGKILTCVSNAREIRDAILAEHERSIASR